EEETEETIGNSKKRRLKYGGIGRGEEEKEEKNTK
ncbi:hypothetical protein Pmani_011510, partial [Petrolisthes manimaculis]